MAQDYSKLKNAELENLLKERNLPHTGKKAEMVARLVEHDKSSKNSQQPSATQPASTTSASASTKTTATTTATTAAAPASGNAVEDEISWEDDTTTAAAGTTEAAATAVKAGGQTRAPNPQKVPNQVAAIDPSSTTELSAAAPAPAPTPAQDFSAHLKATELDAELAKRKARAAKFGIPDATSEETIKSIERAKRFGTSNTAAAEGGDAAGVSKLDTALPERPVRGARKRGAPAGTEESSMEDPGLKKRRGPGGKFKRRTGGGGGGGGSATSAQAGKGPTGGGGGGGGGRGGKWMNDAERAKAEARKARFATASASAA